MTSITIGVMLFYVGSATRWMEDLQSGPVGSDRRDRRRGTMIRSFRDRGTADLFHGVNSKAARRVCPTGLVRVAVRKLGMVDAAEDLNDLRVPPNNKLEKLTKDRIGQHAIRINEQFRVCFVWTETGAEQVEVTDYH